MSEVQSAWSELKQMHKIKLTVKQLHMYGNLFPANESANTFYEICNSKYSYYTIIQKFKIFIFVERN